MPTPKVDQKTAAEIERDMAAIDKKDEAEREETAKEEVVKDCDCMGLSIDGKPGTGLIDAHTRCPRCAGTGKVVDLG